MQGIFIRWSAPAGVVLITAALLLTAAGGRVRALLASSLQLGLGASAIAAMLGLMLALLMLKTDAPGRHAAWLMIGGLLLLPLHLHAAAWQAGFGLLGWATQAAAVGGPIDPWLADTPGAVWVHAMAATPWATLIIAAALRGGSASHEEAASLDAAPATVLRRITFRRAAMGVLLAAFWTMMTCAAEMTVTDLFGVRTFAEEVYTQAALGMFDGAPSLSAGVAPGGQAGAAVLDSGPALGPVGLGCGVALLVVMAVAALAVGVRCLLDPNDQETGRRWAWRLGRAKPIAAAATLALLTLVAALPIANLAYQAGVQVDRADGGWTRRWSAAKLARMVASAPWEHRRELAPSLGLAAVVASTTVLIGVLLAWRLRRGGAGAGLALLLIAAGLAIPGPLFGIATIWLLNQPTESPLAWLTGLYDHTWFAPWLVQTLRVTPLAALAVWPALASVPRELIDSAATDGAGGWSALWRVAAPIRLPAIGVAWLVGFAGSFGELAATLLVLPPGPQTVTARVFSLLHYGVEDRVASLCLLLIAGYLILGATAAWLVGRTRLKTLPTTLSDTSCPP